MTDVNYYKAPEIVYDYSDVEAPQSSDVAETYATLKTSIEETLPEDAHKKYVDNVQKAQVSKDQFDSELINSLLEDRKESMESYISQAPSDDEIFTDNKLMGDVVNSINKEITDPLAPEMAIAVQYLPETASEEWIREEAATIRGYQVISKVLENQTFSDKVINFSGMLLSDMSWDLSKIEYDFDVAVQKYQSLPPEEKVIFFEQLAIDLQRATDSNELKTAAVLSLFLDAEGAEKLKGELQLDKLFLGIDVAGIGGLAKIGPLANMANRLKRQSNLLRVSRNRPEETAKIVKDVLSDTDKLNTKLSKTNAYTAGSVFKNEHILPEVPNGVHNAVYKAVSEKSLDETRAIRILGLELLDESYTLGATEIFDKAKTSQSMIKATEQLRRDLKAISKKTPLETIDDVDVISKHKRGFTLQAKIKSTESGVEEVVTRDITFGEGEVGSFEQIPTIGAIKKYLASDKLKFGTDEGDTVGRLVETSELTESTSGKFNAQYDKMWRIALEPISTPIGKGAKNLLTFKKPGTSELPITTASGKTINKTSFDKVSMVATHGDELGEAGERFTVNQLMEDGVNIPGVGTVRLTEGETRAYYNLLEIGDHAWMADNELLRNEMLFRGMKAFDFGNDQVFGKPIESEQSITSTLNSLNSRVGTRIYDPSKPRGWVHTRGLTSKQIKQEGKVLVQLNDSVPVKSGKKGKLEYFDVALVKQSDIKTLPHVVKPRRTAYIPKINRDVNYLIKESSGGFVNGVARDSAAVKTIHFFDGPKSAQARALKLNEEARLNKTGKTYTVSKDRQFSVTGFDKEVTMPTAGPGLFRGARSTREIPFNIEEVRPDRVNAFEAMMRNTQHLSNKLPRNDWRMDMQSKWVHSANEVLASGGGKKISKFTDEIEDVVGARELNEVKEYINQQLRIPDKSEVTWERLTRGLADWMEGKVLLDTRVGKNNRSLRKTVLNISSLDPIVAARTATFHSLLGWFNPAQLFIQAQNASIAMSLHPKLGGRAIPKAIAMRSIAYVDNAEVAAHTIKQLNDTLVSLKMKPIDTVEFLDDWKAWRKTGLSESIRSTADHAAATQGLPISANAISRAADKGLFFFREGEISSRLFAFLIARKEARMAGTLADEVGTFSRAQDLMLNMSRASRAAWQKNEFLALPTQFLQVHTKFIEKAILPRMLGGSASFSGKEKAKLLFGQTMLYGAAGVPFGNYLLNQAAQMFGKDTTELTDSDIEYSLDQYMSFLDNTLIKQGITGAVLGQGEVVVAPRAAIASGIEDLIFGMFEQDKDINRLLLGAFSTLYGRGADTINGLGAIVSDTDWTATDYVIHLNNLSRLTSTTNNIVSAWFMANNEVYYNQNFGVIANTEFSPTEYLFKLSGFQPSYINDLSRLQLSKKHRELALNSLAEKVFKRLENYYALAPESPETAQKMLGELHLMVNANLQKEEDRKDVLKKIANKIKAPSKDKKIIMDAINMMNSEYANKSAISSVLKRSMQEARDNQ